MKFISLFYFSEYKHLKVCLRERSCHSDVYFFYFIIFSRLLKIMDLEEE